MMMRTNTTTPPEAEYTVYGSLQAVAARRGGFDRSKDKRSVADRVRVWWARAVKEYGLVAAISRLMVVGSIFYALVAVGLFFSGSIARLGFTYFNGELGCGGEIGCDPFAPAHWGKKFYGALLVGVWLAGSVLFAFFLAGIRAKSVEFRKLWDDPPVVYGTPRSGKGLSEQQSLEDRVGETL